MIGNKLYLGDCLELMDNIKDKSVDMILCDLPYGTTSCDWDKIISLNKLWVQYERVIKDDGAIVLTAQQPFTSVLIHSNLPLYKYNWVWVKNKIGGFFNAKNRPLKSFEDICVFSKSPAANVKGCKMKYFPQGVVKSDINRVNSERSQKDTIQNRVSRKGSYTQKQTGYPKNILYIDCVTKTIHPTQKPVALMEYLIKTYTNEGDLVLDNTMGSGTTCVAAVNTNRRYIGMEMNEEYFEIAQERVSQAKQNKQSELTI